MSFTLNPDDAPPRLIRFCGREGFPHDDVIAMLDPAFNLLRVNKSLYEQLADSEKGKVLKTRQSLLEVTT